MKKLCITFLSLCFIYMTIVWIQTKLDSGHHISYTVNTENQGFQIEEIYYKKKNQANYWIQVETHGKIFPIQVYVNKEVKQLIEAVYYFEDDEYTCIYPIGKNLGNIDVLCQKENTIYPYHSMDHSDLQLTQFVDRLKEYDATKFMDTRSVLMSQDGISIYNNLIDQHIIGFENYKGLHVLDRTNLLRSKRLFTNDVYQKNVQLFYQGYYVVANYNENYEFHEVFVINMDNLKQTKMISDLAISFDSYIQGVVDQSIYLLDRTNKRQYCLDLNRKTISKVGDVDLGVKVYQNGSWITMTMYDVLKDNVCFKNSELPEEVDAKLYIDYEKVGDYYYLYQQTETGVMVYRIHTQLPTVRYYIATISNINQVDYIGDYFYYRDKDSLYYYHDLLGSRIVVMNPEMEFNSDLQFGIYSK